MVSLSGRTAPMTVCEELKLQRILAMIEHFVPLFGSPMFVLLLFVSLSLR